MTTQVLILRCVEVVFTKKYQCEIPSISSSFCLADVTYQYAQMNMYVQLFVVCL